MKLGYKTLVGALIFLSIALASGNTNAKEGSFYLGLDYTPAFSRIKDFSIEGPGGEIKGIFPYLKDGQRMTYTSDHFDWHTPDPNIGFKNNILALEGSFGYKRGGARFEVEIGHEKFKTQVLKESDPSYSGEAVFLLAKELANGVIKDQTSELAEAIGRVSRQDMYAFSNAINIADIELDEKICSKVTRTPTDTDTAGRCTCPLNANGQCDWDDIEVRAAYHLRLISIPGNAIRTRVSLEEGRLAWEGVRNTVKSLNTRDMVSVNMVKRALNGAASTAGLVGSIEAEALKFEAAVKGLEKKMGGGLMGSAWKRPIAERMSEVVRTGSTTEAKSWLENINQIGWWCLRGGETRGDGDSCGRLISILGLDGKYMHMANALRRERGAFVRRARNEIITLKQRLAEVEKGAGQRAYSVLQQLTENARTSRGALSNIFGKSKADESLVDAVTMLAIAYQRFPIQGVSGGKGDDGDAVFLLAKELANDVVRDQTTKLSDAIAKTVTRKEMHSFSNTINVDAKDVNTKICKHMPKGKNSEKGQPAWVENKPFDKGPEVCACPNVAANAGTGGNICKADSGAATKWEKDVGGTLSKAFGEDFATSNDKVDVNTAKVISEDIRDLTNKEEKSKVAGAFAKTIEGAEVVEVKAVTSTSVIVNACYDLINDSIGVIPYACVGIGGNFVGVVEGHVTPKLACKVKAGLSYSITPEITAFLGGFYHRVLGDDEYEDLPAMLNLHAHIA